MSNAWHCVFQLIHNMHLNEKMWSTMIVEWSDEDRSNIRHLFNSHTRARAVIFPSLDLGRGKVCQQVDEVGESKSLDCTTNRKTGQQ